MTTTLPYNSACAVKFLRRTFVRDSLVALFPERKETTASNGRMGRGKGSSGFRRDLCGCFQK